mmetsp:Transcript_37075/g.90117  ORF Transcript_37075/g.90117 Transcript_37075/m.90117 type:complete len:232 (+) Transcript_37075:704-1399(+)
MANADGGVTDVTPVANQLGTELNIETKAISKVCVLSEDQIALSMVLKVFILPGLEVRISVTSGSGCGIISRHIGCRWVSWRWIDRGGCGCRWVGCRWVSCRCSRGGSTRITRTTVCFRNSKGPSTLLRLLRVTIATIVNVVEAFDTCRRTSRGPFKVIGHGVGLVFSTLIVSVLENPVKSLAWFSLLTHQDVTSGFTLSTECSYPRAFSRSTARCAVTFSHERNGLSSIRP